MNDTYRRFRENILKSVLIEDGDRVLLSMSAGKDSIALFYLMERLKEDISFKTAVFHLNHLTRGKESDRDEEYIRNLTEKYGITIHSMKYDFSSNSNKGLSFEENARNVRYYMIEELCLNYGYNKTATAHNLNDRAETVLMRVLSGTGIRGLRGIDAHTGGLIRPMLIFPAEEIYGYLEANEITWREDESNNDEKYLRNYVRKSLFPVIDHRFTDAVKNINRLADHAAENDKLLDNLVSDKYKDCWSIKEKSFTINMDTLPRDEALVKYILSGLLYKVFGLKISYAVIEEILRNYRSMKSNITVYSNPIITIEKKISNNEKILHVYDTKYKDKPLKDWEYTVDIESSNNIFIDEIKNTLYFEKVDNKGFSQNMFNEGKVFISLPENCSSIVIRNRRAGDRILLKNGSKKIKDLLIEKKLDTVSKSIVPILEMNNSIAAFLPGFAGLSGNRVSREFKVNNNSEKIIAIYSSGTDLNKQD
jgi:tRNA(Ile)-lysidine synthase